MGYNSKKTGGNLSSQRRLLNLKLFICCCGARLLASGGCQHGEGAGVGDYRLHFAGRQTHILSASLANCGMHSSAAMCSSDNAGGFLSVCWIQTRGNLGSLI